MVKRGYRQPNGGIGKIRMREPRPHALSCLKFNCDALARCSEPLPSTHTFSFLLFGHVVGANGTAAQEGSQGIPPHDYMGGGVCPHISTMFK